VVFHDDDGFLALPPGLAAAARARRDP
jgi:hypothetical protein